MTNEKECSVIENITKEKAGSKVLDQFYVEILSGRDHESDRAGRKRKGRDIFYPCSVMNVRIRERYGLRERSMKKGRNCPSKDPTGYFYRKSRTDHSEPERGREPVYY